MKNQKIHYRVVKDDSSARALEEALNQLGADGYQVVATIQAYPNLAGDVQHDPRLVLAKSLTPGQG